MIYTHMTKKALKLSFEAHKDQVDKSGMPYVYHPFHLAEQMKDEEEIEQLSEKLTKLKRRIKVSILILAILFLATTLVGILFMPWALFGLLPLGAAMLIIYFANRQKMINMEVELEIKEKTIARWFFSFKH